MKTAWVQSNTRMTTSDLDQIQYIRFQGDTIDMVLCVACFGVSFCTVFTFNVS